MAYYGDSFTFFTYYMRRTYEPLQTDVCAFHETFAVKF
jgi:hypothetical protein